MRALAHSEGMALQRLAREIGLSHSTVSGIVDRLEGKGWVQRRVDGQDRRRTVITISSTIREYMRTTLPDLTHHPLAAAVSGMKATDRAALARLLRTLNESLRRATIESGRH
jgi:DNA-binding MarR family transcriptional regulator